MKDHGPVAWAEESRAKAAVLIEPLRATAREHGYAIGVHGSLARDIDLIAAPWVTEAAPAEVLIAALVETIKAHNNGVALVLRPARNSDPHDERGKNPVSRPHGRLAWAIHLGGGPYIDISVMPRALAKRCLCCGDSLFPDEKRLCSSCAAQVCRVAPPILIVLGLLVMLFCVGCGPVRTTYSAPWVPPPWKTDNWKACDEIPSWSNEPCVYCADTALDRKNRAVPTQCTATILVTWTKENK